MTYGFTYRIVDSKTNKTIASEKLSTHTLDQTLSHIAKQFNDARFDCEDAMLRCESVQIGDRSISNPQRMESASVLLMLAADHYGRETIEQAKQQIGENLVRVLTDQRRLKKLLEAVKRMKLTELDLPSLDKGDVLLVGKFKNRKAEITGFDKDENNQPVAKTTKGDQKIFKPRVQKLMPPKVQTEEENLSGHTLKYIKDGTGTHPIGKCSCGEAFLATYASGPRRKAIKAEFDKHCGNVSRAEKINSTVVPKLQEAETLPPAVSSAGSISFPHRLKPIKVITTHKGYGQFLAQVDADYEGWINRIKGIPSPYHFSNQDEVFKWHDKHVFVMETRHKRYEVYEVPEGVTIRKDPNSRTALEDAKEV